MPVCRTRMYTLLENCANLRKWKEKEQSTEAVVRLLCINNINSQRYSPPPLSFPSLSFSLFQRSIIITYWTNKLQGGFANFIKLRQRATRRFQRAQADLLRDYLASYSIPVNNSATLTTLEDTPRWKEKDDHPGVYSTRTLCISFTSHHRAFHPVPKDNLQIN